LRQLYECREEPKRGKRRYIKSGMNNGKKREEGMLLQPIATYLTAIIKLLLHFIFLDISYSQTVLFILTIVK